jgi:hypothetical protein
MREAVDLACAALRLHAGLGLGEGQVENPVGLVRERFFTPRIRVNSYEELNERLTSA